MSKEAMETLSAVSELERQIYELMARAEEVKGSDTRSLKVALTNLEQGCMWLKRGILPNHTAFGGNA